jgi:UDP-glucose 4-epimerase
MIENILITGSHGYIGSHLVNFLKPKKINLFLVDDLSNSVNAKKERKFYKIKISNLKKIEKIIKLNNIDSVIHLAAKINARESQNKKKLYKKVNYTDSKNLLNICLKNGVKNFIFASSAAVYGNYKKKFSENDIKKPINYYGKTKIDFENYLRTKKINFAILRFFNVAGFDNKNFKNNFFAQSFINILVKNYVKKKKTNIFGNNFKTKDGFAERDFIHIKDIIKIIFKSLNYINKNNKNIILNCGTSKKISILSIISILKKIGCQKVNFNITSQVNGDSDCVISNNKKLKKILGLKNFLSIKKILNSSIKYYRSIFI